MAAVFMALPLEPSSSVLASSAFHSSPTTSFGRCFSTSWAMKPELGLSSSFHLKLTGFKAFIAYRLSLPSRLNMSFLRATSDVSLKSPDATPVLPLISIAWIAAESPNWPLT